MKFEPFLKKRIFIPVVIVILLITVSLLKIIPNELDERITKNAVNKSKNMVESLKTFRSYYNQSIIPKIKSDTHLKINYDHWEQKDTVPLPTTTIHDLSKILTQDTNLKVRMYSDHPFPNRADRKLDKYQKQALAYLIKNPNEIYIKKEKINGKDSVRVAIPDFLTSPKCVTCHNTRFDTPKNNWKLGDVRGVIEVDVPIDEDLLIGNDFIKLVIVLFIFTVTVILLLQYLYISYKKSVKLTKDNENLESIVDKRTSELVESNSILKQYKELVDLTAVVSRADKNGVIIYSNKNLENISGYNKNELLGKTHNILRHPDEQTSLFKDLWKTILSKNIWQGIIKNKKKNGDAYYVNCTIMPILDTDGNITEFLALRYDISDLISAKEKAQSAEMAKSLFLASMSHELRTPLNAILGFSQILLLSKDISPKTKDFVNKIYISGNNLLSLVNTILDFSKIESGKMDIHVASFKLNMLFEGINVILEPQQKAKHLKLESYTFTNEMIHADEQLIKQVFINLLSNAIKFSFEGGMIRLDYFIDKINNCYHFTLCNQGKNIPQKTLERLFEPFHQGVDARKNYISGTGLGLAISKRIVVELHHGKIWAENITDGVCFHITLPIID